jgi:glycosyltransferase involved in cell wall biosynthesis
MNSSPPLISIVLPVHNGEGYLAKALDSCLEQTYEDWELIIVDDCSTDNTPDIIKAYCERDQRIGEIRNLSNLKLPASLNVGFHQARGDYLTWTSDDNRYRPDALEQMIQYLQQDPDIGIVYADYDKIDGKGSVVQECRLKTPDFLAVGNIIRACFLFHRRVHEKVGDYRTDLFTAEDYDYWLRCSIHFRFGHLGKCLYQYRIHEQSLSKKYPELVLKSTEETLSRHLPAMKWVGTGMRAQGYLRLAELNQRLGRPWSSLGYMFRSWLTCPGLLAQRKISKRSARMLLQWPSSIFRRYPMRSSGSRE